jgi:hypothetical protein
VDETEHFCGGRGLCQSADYVGVGNDVGLKLAGFDIENEDEDRDGAEDVGALVS